MCRFEKRDAYIEFVYSSVLECSVKKGLICAVDFEFVDGLDGLEKNLGFWFQLIGDVYGCLKGVGFLIVPKKFIFFNSIWKLKEG